MPKAVINGVRIGYDVQGQGEPLIMIMGFAGRRGAWLLQTRAFRKHFMVIALDNRGVGGSDRPSEPYTMRDMADDVVGLMDHLGIDRAHVLGMSLGGVVAQEVAINYPERVIKLVLASTYPGGEETETMSREIRENLGLREGFSPEDMRSVDILEFMGTVTARSFNNKLFRTIMVPLSRRYASSIGLDSLLAQFEASATSNTLDRLHLIEAVTLVITGSEDRVLPPRSSEVIEGKIPNSRLVKLEGGSHSIHIEMRGTFNREVLGFLLEG